MRKKGLFIVDLHHRLLSLDVWSHSQSMPFLPSQNIVRIAKENTRSVL
jgi:hypothetical protein